MEGCSRFMLATISVTERSCRARKLRMSRRRGSAMALKASEVVEARGMGGEYIPIWEYVKRNLAVWKKSWLAERTGGGGVAHGALLLSSTQGVMWIVALGRDGRQARHAVSVLLYRGGFSTLVLVNFVGAIEVRKARVRAVESRRGGGGVAAGPDR